MSTPYSYFYTVFFKKIEQDRDFFDYYNLTPEEALTLAKERAKGYLHEALSKLTLECTVDVDFNDYDDILEVVNVECTNTEIQLLGSLMFEMYIEKDIAKIKVYNVNFTPEDLKVFDPSSGRKTFMEMYLQVQENNIVMLDRYNSRDRLTGKRKTIDYNSYNESEV